MKGFEYEMSKIFRQCTLNAIEWELRVDLGGASIEPIRIICFT